MSQMSFNNFLSVSADQVLEDVKRRMNAGILRLKSARIFKEVSHEGVEHAGVFSPTRVLGRRILCQKFRLGC